MVMESFFDYEIPSHNALGIVQGIIFLLLISKKKADDRTRTDNLLITSQLLCQLSHIGLLNSGDHLLSQAAAHQVPSTA